MQAFSISFHTTDDLILRIISILLALFIVGTWLYNSSHLRLIYRIIGSVIGGFAAYYVALLFFGILQLSFTTVQDNFSAEKTTATIISYKEFVSESSTRRYRSSSRRTSKNTFYKPLLEYKDKKGAVKNSFGDVSFSKNNIEPVGSKVEIIIRKDHPRMITPIKNFTFVVNIISLSFLIIFYYIFYNYAKTQSLESTGNFVLTVFGFVIFPVAFIVLIYLFLGVGYDYFIMGKKYISRNMAILFSGLGIFLILCLFGLMRYIVEKKILKQKKKKNKKNKKSVQNRSVGS